MVRRYDRDIMVDLLVKFFRGEITNFQFEEGIPDSDDSAIWPIVSSVWCFYDDIAEHKIEDRNSLTENDKVMIDRWVLFLKTNTEYEWPVMSYPGIRPLKHGVFSKLIGKKRNEDKFMASGAYEIWPFFNQESYNNALGLYGSNSIWH